MFTPIPPSRALIVIERQAETPAPPQTVNAVSNLTLLPARTRDNERALIYVHMQLMKQHKQKLIWAAYDAGQAISGCDLPVDLFAPSNVCRFNSRVQGGFVPWHSSNEGYFNRYERIGA